MLFSSFIYRYKEFYILGCPVYTEMGELTRSRAFSKASCYWLSLYVFHLYMSPSLSSCFQMLHYLCSHHPSVRGKYKQMVNNIHTPGSHSNSPMKCMHQPVFLKEGMNVVSEWRKERRIHCTGGMHVGGVEREAWDPCLPKLLQNLNRHYSYHLHMKLLRIMSKTIGLSRLVLYTLPMTLQNLRKKSFISHIVWAFKQWCQGLNLGSSVCKAGILLA